MIKPIKSNSGWDKRKTKAHLFAICLGTPSGHQQQWLAVIKPGPRVSADVLRICPKDEVAKTTPVLKAHWIWQRRSHLSTQPSIFLSCRRVRVNERAVLLDTQ